MKKFLMNLVLILIVAPQAAFFDFAVTPPKELNLDNIKRISRACYLIQHEYYDPARIKPREMMEEGFFELAKEVPEVLPKFSGDSMTFQLASKQITINLTSVSQFYDILFPVSQAFDLIAENYAGEVKPEDMEYAFISGMLSILDPHSSMLPPKAYEEFKTQTSGQYGGLGIVIGEKENELTVIAPIEDTPAWRAGIRTDDKILQIGGQATANMDLSDAVDLMRGAPGTKVTLRLRSKAEEPRDVTLTREVIAIVSVQTQLLAEGGKNVGVIRIKGFQEDTYSDMLKGLAKLDKESGGNLAGLVIDMRNNPGGLLDQAILIADKFLSSGDIVYTQAANEADEDAAVAKKQDGDIALPMVVLLNEGSASASEIVAGALKNNDRAVVIGQTSFGKGSVQSLFSLRDGSSLKLTVAQYLTPGKISIQAEGISPDIHLYPSLVKEGEFHLREDQDFSESKLDSHLENVKYLHATKPFYEMTYLKEQQTSEESQYVSKIRAEDDYPLQLSAKLLAGAAKNGAADKKTLLAKFKESLDDESEDQDRKIAQAFKKLGVDWTAGNKNVTPDLSYSYQFLDEAGHPVSELAASTKAKLRVTLKNDGAEPAHRVLGKVESYNPLIDTKEIAFGTIKPGESASGEVAVSVPTEIINFKEDASFNVYTDETGDTPVKRTLTTFFTEKLSPQLAYSYVIHDGGKAGSKGNGNGIPEKGETVAFDVTVKNLGPGVSEKTEVNLQNTLGDHVFLNKARASVGALKSGQTANAELAFDVRESFDGNEFSIKFFAMDDETKASIADTLKFAKGPDGAAALASPGAGAFQIIPRIDVSELSTQKLDRYKVVASIANDSPLKDIAVFVKGKKIYYDNLQASQPTRSKTIDVEVPLEDGLNAIVIQARGDRDLISQKNLSVVYHDPAKVARAK